jgi:hypothetical protein
MQVSGPYQMDTSGIWSWAWRMVLTTLLLVQVTVGTMLLLWALDSRLVFM